MLLCCCALAAASAGTTQPENAALRTLRSNWTHMERFDGFEALSNQKWPIQTGSGLRAEVRLSIDAKYSSEPIECIQFCRANTTCSGFVYDNATSKCSFHGGVGQEPDALLLAKVASETSTLYIKPAYIIPQSHSSSRVDPIPSPVDPIPSPVIQVEWEPIPHHEAFRGNNWQIWTPHGKLSEAAAPSTRPDECVAWCRADFSCEGLVFYADIKRCAFRGGQGQTAAELLKGASYWAPATLFIRPHSPPPMPQMPMAPSSTPILPEDRSVPLLIDTDVRLFEPHWSNA